MKKSDKFTANTQHSDTERETIGTKLLFEENFETSELDPTKWELCPEQQRHGKLDVWDNEMTMLDGKGHLILRAVWDEENNRVRSGAIRSRGRFEAGYGYYEASIKFPVAPGSWGAFWMMCGNVTSEENGSVDGVEIDIVETLANGSGACSSALHWDGYKEAHKYVSSGDISKFDIYDGNFHTFALERTAESYVFYIDGEITWYVTPDMCEPCPEDGHILLTVEATDWLGAGTPESIAALPADMVVDYVRVYSTKP